MSDRSDFGWNPVERETRQERVDPNNRTMNNKSTEHLFEDSKVVVTVMYLVDRGGTSLMSG
jgi:hypothetical protein